MDQALTANPELRAGLIWADQSELALHGLMGSLTARLQERYPGRVGAQVLEGHRHAYCNDIYFHGAVMLQAIKNTKSLELTDKLSA